MKSKFAKFTDATLGAALIFLAATAVMRYYTSSATAVFCAAAITLCLLTLLSATRKRRESEQRLSADASQFYFDLMFEDDRQTAKRLHSALSIKEPDSALRGNGIFLRSSALFCCFEKSDERTVAKLIKKAERSGATKITVLSQTPPAQKVDIDGMSVIYVNGDSAYKLFASLGALPECTHKKPKRRRFFYGALDKNRLPRYAALSAAMFTVSFFFGGSPVLITCASVSAALFAATAVLTAVRSLKPKKPDRRD